MGSSRKKSCVQCRRNKARCSRGIPCLHCQERSWDCQYDTTQRVERRSLRPLAPIGDQTAPEVPVKNIGVEELFQSSHPNLATIDVGQYEPGLAWLPPDDHRSHTKTWTQGSLPVTSVSLNTMDFNLSDTSLIGPLNLPGFEQPLQADSSEMNGFRLTPFLEEIQVNQSQWNQCRMSPKSLWEGSKQQCAKDFPSKLYHNKPFSKRRVAGMENAITTEVLLGQILSYPSMMAKGGRLPPFIFPPCATAGLATSNKCSSNGFHKCLPASLAICSSLIQSYESRTTGNTEFVWRNILNELRRFRQEYQAYGRKELLEALQASIIYLLLQANDQDSIYQHDIKLLISTPGDLAKSIHDACEYQSNMPSGSALDRTEWIFRESVRRTICLLYGTELLIDVFLSPTDKNDCGGYSMVPLPCSRDLWQPLSDEEWVSRVERIEEDNNMKDLLKIADLQLSRRAAQLKDKNTKDYTSLTSQISKWSRALDEFGVLVWMAALLD